MDADTIYDDGTYLAKNPTWHEQDSAWKARQISKILKKNGIGPATICEIGCGAGEILNCLSQEHGKGVVFSGYEISPQAFDICKTKETANLHYFLKDLFDEPVFFDAVMAIDVFEHVEDYFGFLRRLKAKGTYKLFHIPLDISVANVFRRGRLMKERSSVGHIHYFMKDTALATLRDTGYEIVDWAYTNSGIELEKPGWKAAFMRPIRRILFNLNRDATVRVLGGFSLMVLAK